MIRNQIFEQIEPEQRNLRKDIAFVRNAGTQNMIECRNPIGRHQQKSAIYRVQVAHLAAPEQGNFAKVGLQ